MDVQESIMSLVLQDVEAEVKEDLRPFPECSVTPLSRLHTLLA